MTDTRSEIVQAVSALDADVLYVSGVLDRDTADILREVHSRRTRGKCILVLTTFGGDPAAAYLMARFLRDVHPDGFTVFIPGPCKSAGTLLALGAREIVMGDRGELGPLDIQVSEKDEPFRFASGLELFTTLNSLAQNTFTTFETYLLQLIGRSQTQISMKAAARIATDLTVGIMAPISQQIDPLQLGRRERALNIVKAYAERLGVPQDVVAKLATGYPDHGFVIDLAEAKLLLKSARGPTEDEANLEAALGRNFPGLYDPLPQGQTPLVLRLNDILRDEDNANHEETDDEQRGVRADPKAEHPEVDGERAGDGAELHQADAPH